jgi:hypothetical protein
MKSAKEIIDAINQFYHTAVERPPWYFRSLRAMEDELCLLESIYEFILDDSSEFIPPTNGFGKFLNDNGYGTLGYCFGKIDGEEFVHREPVKAPSDEEAKQMEALGQFWQQYLSSERRLQVDA